MSSLQRGIVKQVTSGDTIVIKSATTAVPPPERVVSIAHVTAPRLARKQDGVEVNDEPYAFASREFLRKKIVGREVFFNVEYKVPNGREYVTLFFGAEKENIGKTLLSEGWVRLREGARPSAEDAAEYATLTATAESKKIGVFADPSAPGAVRNIQYNADARSLVDTYKGKPVDAIIEQVRDGASFRVYLVPSSANVAFILSGVKAPGFKQSEDKKTELAEPFAVEAKYFTESRLLQREVKLVLEGTQNQSVVGSVIHPAGNIAEFLLAEGLAKVVDWSIGIVSQGRDKYRAAEKSAKDRKVRLWKDHQSSTKNVNPATATKFTGTVVEIASPENIVVNVDGVYKRITFSSIRQPRIEADKTAAVPGEAKEVKDSKDSKEGKGKKPLYDVPYFFEAREFLRKKLIGKPVEVSVDFVRAANDNFPERVCATVRVGGVNVAEALVSKGLATVQRYKATDDERSANYDDLLAAESSASKNQVGVHSKKEHSPIHVNDIATSEIASRYLASFKRADHLTGIVEHVVAGSRLKVFIVKDSCLATIVLAGITCPRNSKEGKSEPFADEALAFTRTRLHQHEVELDIEDMDKTGAFIGHVLIGGKNLASLLLEEGLAQVHFSSSKYRNAIEMAAVEEKAKKAKKGLWLTYVEPVKQEVKVDDLKAEKASERVIVTEVSTSNTFWAQSASAEASIEEVSAELRSALAKTTPPPHVPKLNELVAAKFSVDGLWYRAKIIDVSSSTASQVLFIDYGNNEVVENKNITALPGTTARLAAQAKQYKIACTNPAPSEWAQAATSAASDALLSKAVNVTLLYTDGTDNYVTVVDAESQEDLGLQLARAGFLSAAKRREPYLKETVQRLEQAQTQARSERAGMWIYGDVTSDDAKEFGYAQVKKA